MKGLEWGRLYREFGARSYNPAAIEKDVSRLMADKEVQNNKGVYEYLLSDRTREEKLNLRQFDDDEKRAAYETQTAEAKTRGASNCPLCAAKGSGEIWDISEMEGDHIVPWSKGGKTVPENLQMLCKRCNALKSDK